LFPSIGFLPVIWHTRDMDSLPELERRGFYTTFQ
jgi:hypothetical protein